MPDFTPVVYLKDGCPFCLKLRLFLLEAGLSDSVELVQPPAEGHQALGDELAPHLGKATFPAAQLAPGEYLADSDALVEHFAKTSGVDPKSLPTYQQYVGHVFPKLMQLYRENAQLKKNIA